MKFSKVCTLMLLAALCLSGMSGCQEEKKPDFSGYTRIAELATLDCTFHNVAEVNNPGTNVLFGINVGYKKAWFEYDGKLDLGIDVSRVKIEGPDARNVVSITVPKAQVLGLPDADESTFSDVYQDTGLFTPVTALDKSEAYKTAQTEMKETAESDDVLMNQARKRAETLLGQYVQNIGDKLGQNYEIRFIEVD